jgi:hypothetical protein
MNYKTIMLQLGEQEREVEIEFNYYHGEPARLTGHPDDRHPGEPESFEICAIFDVETKLIIADDLVGQGLIRLLEEEIITKLKGARDEF